jgi:tRNA G46 methylase TrmB
MDDGSDDNASQNSTSSASNDADNGDGQYESRKPKWWTKLARRRGTKSQRQAIQRMTHRGYFLSKEVLADFSRINNRSNRYGNTDALVNDYLSDQWKRCWWNRVLAVKELNDAPTECAIDTSIVVDDRNKKYASKFRHMIEFTNIRPARQFNQRWLEIGFGNAKNNPVNLYIGSEIHQPGLGALAQKIEADDSLDNIFILPGDGIKLLYHLPNNYLDTILITFPDPWPKEFHARWRVVQTETIREMKRVLNANGRVFVATDAVGFNDWSREIFTDENSDWSEIMPCPARDEWLPIVSYYEEKGLNEGRHTMLQCWQVAGDVR